MIGSPEEIVQRYMEIIGECDQRGVARFPLAAFVSADGVLTEVQIHCQLKLGDPPRFSQLFQSKIDRIIINFSHPLLTNIIPIWYNKNIPKRDILFK